MSESDQLLPHQSQEEYRTEVKNDRTFRVYKRRFYVVVIYSLVAFTQAWNWNTWGPIATSAKAAYGWSNGMVALLPAWGPIMYITTVFGFSWLIEVKGRRIWNCFSWFSWNELTCIVQKCRYLFYTTCISIFTWGLRCATLIGAFFLVLGSGVQCITQESPYITWYD